MTTHYLACDLGAESGRLMLGSLDGAQLALEEIHRFPNTPVQRDGSLHWNIPALFEELKAGLKKAAARPQYFSGLSTDAWGLDYVLLAEDGSVIGPTFHYRDPRTARGVAAVKAKLPWKTIFAETGIQFLPMNTIFQLGAESPERLAGARQLLMIGDAFNFFLSGVSRMEESMASTSQLYNPRTRAWSKRLIGVLPVPEGLFPAIVPSGTRLGKLKPELARETGLPQIDVIATCSHDTGAAVAAVPASGTDWAYLSSGTWSLMGVELKAPILNDACRELNFTNEIGFGGSVRLLKNIVGLWIVQECRREWGRAGGPVARPSGALSPAEGERDGEREPLDYATLTRWAAEAPPFVSLINPADPRFVGPDDMPARITAFCRETRQPAPAHPGATIRCVLESLALLYRRTLRQAEALIGRKIERLHIVGGGSRNELLNQFTANALQIPVLAGPAEATAAGNILIQAISLGHLPSLEAARQVVANSFHLRKIQPESAGEWLKANERFEKFF